jgi:hypothetical protein
MVMQTTAHVNLDGSWWPHLGRSCSCWLLVMPWASRSCRCEVVLIRGPCTFSSRQFGYESINFVNGLLFGSRTAMHVRPPADNQPTRTSPRPPYSRRIPLRYGTTGLTTCPAECPRYQSGGAPLSVSRSPHGQYTRDFILQK